MGGEGCHIGPLAGDKAEERLGTAGLQAELVQRAGPGVGEIVSPLGLLAQDLLASACPSVRGWCVPPVPTVPCSSPGGIVQHWDPALS